MPKATSEIIFVRGATEGINLVASSYGKSHLSSGDEILITEMEHHSNIVPWQILCEHMGAKLKIIPVNDNGELVIDSLDELLNKRTKIVSVVHVSNSLGTVNPVTEITKRAHKVGAIVVVDGAQAVAHMPIDVREIDCDFYTFSSHKMYGPTGTGVLYGKEALLEKMPPYQGGGDMIRHVSFEKTLYNELPNKFEAGTPNIAGVVGLGAAIDYLNEIGWKPIQKYEDNILQYATNAIENIPQLKMFGKAKNKVGVLSFTIDDIHPHDIGTALDYFGIAIRAGHHCTQPLMDRFGILATARASLGLYNTKKEVDALASGIWKLKEVFK